MAGERELSVAFPGFEDNVGRMLAGFDLFVTASEVEGLPNTVVEAGACGIPVIATAAGATGEVITDETGWLIPVGDDRVLARTVRDVCENWPEAQRRAGNLRRLVEQEFDAAAMVRRTEAVWHELLDFPRNWGEL
jgi:glycosyltransferase involved in cell wall biosynthesis